MNITYKNAVKNVKKFQQGGPMGPEGAPAEGAPEGGEMPAEGAPEGGAPEGAPEGGGEDPIAQLVQIFAQGLQNQDCQMLAQGAQMFMELAQQMQGGGGQPAPEGQPVFRKGGKLAYRIKY